jgi:capsular polysaccharide export protein
VRAPLSLWPWAPADLASAECLLPARNRVVPRRVERAPTDEPFVLLALQVVNDVQVVLHAPLIRSMAELLRATLQALPAGYRLLIKEHPNQRRGYGREFYDVVRGDPRCELIDGPLDALIDESRAVVVLNSTVGLDALRRGRTVVILGEAFYGGTGLVHRVTQREEFGPVLAHAVESRPDVRRIAAYLRSLRDEHLIAGHFTDDPPANVTAVADRILGAAIEPRLPLVSIPRPEPAASPAPAAGAAPR